MKLEPCFYPFVPRNVLRDIILAMLTWEAVSGAIDFLVAAVVFTLIVFVAIKRSKKVDAVFQALWKRSWFEMTRKVAWRILLVLFAAGLLLTFYNVWSGLSTVGHHF